MKTFLAGLASACLTVLLTGCAASPAVYTSSPDLPEFLTRPLPPPMRVVENNRDLLQLLADYEALRQRFNADRAATAMICLPPVSSVE